ncbi:gal4p-like zipper protein [Caudoviricetes sp.]|nr:gal4p-like zipper protein [Caudoviricetes sp.]
MTDVRIAGITLEARIAELEQLLIGPEDDGRKLYWVDLSGVVGELITPEDALILGWRYIKAALKAKKEASRG